MKLLIEESVLRQALEAVDELLKTSECCSAYFETDHTNTIKAITALRTALDAAEKVDDQLNQARADALREFLLDYAWDDDGEFYRIELEARISSIEGKKK